MSCTTMYTPGRVLVIGDDTRAFLASIRSLHARGCTVHALPFKPGSPALSSKAVVRCHHLPPPSGTGRDWALGLSRLAREVGFDLILPCCERSLIPITLHAELFEGMTIAHPGREAFAVSLDKGRMHALATDLGVPVAPGRLLAPGEDDAAALIDAYGLPLVMRETSSYAPGRLDRRGRTRILRERDEVAAFLAGMRGNESWHVSGYFPRHGGRPARGQGMGISVLADAGEVLVAFQHARIMEPQDGGSSSARVSEPLDHGLLAHVRAISRAVRLHGLGMYEFRRDPETGEAIFLELNARPWGSMPLAIAAGVDFPSLLYDLLVLGRRPTQPDYVTDLVSRNLLLNLYDVVWRNRLPALHKAYQVARITGEFTAALIAPARAPVAFDTLATGDRRPALMEFVHIAHMARERLAHGSMAGGTAVEWLRHLRDGLAQWRLRKH